MSMTHHVQAVVHQVRQWDDVRVEPHRFGGHQFNLGKVEVGHIHGNGMVDIPFTRRVREGLVGSGMAEPHHLLHQSGWISFYMHAEADVQAAVRLFRLSYLLKRRARTRKQADVQAAIRNELLDMRFANDLNTIIGV